MVGYLDLASQDNLDSTSQARLQALKGHLHQFLALITKQPSWSLFRDKVLGL